MESQPNRHMVMLLCPGIDAKLAGAPPGGLDWPYRMLVAGYVGLAIGGK